MSAYVQLRLKLPEDFLIAEGTATWVFRRTLEVAGRCCDWLLSTKSMSGQMFNLSKRMQRYEYWKQADCCWSPVRCARKVSFMLADTKVPLYRFMKRSSYCVCCSFGVEVWPRGRDILKSIKILPSSLRENRLWSGAFLSCYCWLRQRGSLCSQWSHQTTQRHTSSDPPRALMSARMAAYYCATRKEEISHVDSCWNPGGAGSVSSLHYDFSLM